MLRVGHQPVVRSIQFIVGTTQVTYQLHEPDRTATAMDVMRHLGPPGPSLDLATLLLPPVLLFQDIEYTLTEIAVPSIPAPFPGRWLPIQRLLIPTTVRAITTGAFTNCLTLQEVQFLAPSTLSKIDGFENCVISQIAIPSSVAAIGPTAFRSCRQLTVITFDLPPPIIDIHGFAGCAVLKVEIPPTVRIIGRTAFDRCIHLAHVTFLGSSASRLEALHGFMHCAIREIDIPPSVREIGASAFSFCYVLAIVRFANANDCKLERINGFQGCAIESIDIPVSVRVIGPGAFRNCCSLTRVGVIADGRQVEIQGFLGTPFAWLAGERAGDDFRRFKGWIDAGKEWLRFKREQDSCPGSHPIDFVLQVVELPSAPLTPIEAAGFGVCFDFAPPDSVLQLPFTPTKSRPMYHAMGDGPGSWDFSMRAMGALLITLGDTVRASKPAPRDNTAYALHSQLFCKACGCELVTVGIDTRAHFTLDLRAWCKCLPVWVPCQPEVQSPPPRPRVLAPPDSAAPPAPAPAAKKTAKNCRRRRFRINCSAAWAKMRTVGFFPQHRALKKLAKGIRKSQIPIDQEEEPWYEEVSLSASALRNLKAQMAGTKDTASFVRRLRASGLVRILQGTSSGHCDLQYEDRDVLSLAWLARWADDAYAQASYIQLDCSFGSEPYVFCVPQAIIHNEAIPLGFIIAPSESAEIYELFYGGLDELHGGTTVPPKPILSDEGLGLIAFAEHRHLVHFFCHRHLIEKFGAKDVLGVMVARILRIPRPEEFFEYLPEVQFQLAFLRAADLIDIDQYRLFIRFLGGEDGRFYRHGIWFRARYGVSTCSNHAERFHRSVNKRIAGLSLLLPRLAAIVDLINEKFDRYASGSRRQLKYVLKQLKARGAPQRRECMAPRCVALRNMWGHRFHVWPFPCKHQVSFITVVDPVPAPLALAPPALCRVTMLGEREAWTFNKPDTRPRIAPDRGDYRPPKSLARDRDAFAIELTKELMVLLGERAERSDRYLIVAMMDQFLPLPPGKADLEFRARFRSQSWIWAIAMRTSSDSIDSYEEWMENALQDHRLPEPITDEETGG
jgi:hypothetical protein